MKAWSERAESIYGSFIEFTVTSKKGLVAEAIGTVLGFGGAFTLDAAHLVPLSVIPGAIGAGSALLGLANLEYQNSVHWETPVTDQPDQPVEML